MKKIAIGAVLILAIAACCMPFVNGFAMEKGFKRYLGELNRLYADSGTKASATLVRYERGLFSTEIEWRINLGDLQAFYGIEDVILVENAQHGFTGVTSRSSLEKNGWYLNFVKEKLGGNEPLSLVTTYSIAGDILATLDIRQFAFAVEDVTVEVAPGSMQLRTDLQLDEFVLSGSWGGAGVQDVAAISNLGFNSEITKISSYIWKGDTELKVGAITVEDQLQKVVMNDLKAEYGIDYDPEQNTLNVEAVYGVAGITDGMEKIENASVTIGAKGVDGAAYEEAMRVYIELAGKLFNDISAAGDDPKELERVLQAMLMNHGLQLVAVYEKFLKAGLELYVRDFEADLSAGEVRGGIDLKMVKDLTMAQLLPMMNDPEMIFEYLEYSSDFEMPSELATNSTKLLRPVLPGMSKGVFVEEGSKLVHHAEVRDMKLYLNGEQVNLSY